MIRSLKATVFVAALFCSAAGQGHVTAQAQEKLSISSWGGATQDRLRELYFEPFEKETGIDIVEDNWGGEMSKIRAAVETGVYGSDLYDADPNNAVQGCDEGILEPIDPAFLGDLSDFEPGAITECGIGSHLYTRLWTFNGDKITNAEGPKTIADIFDVQKFPGKRGILKEVFGLAEQALMADGVPPDQVYQVLSSPDGIDRVFRKLDSIKDSIVWYTSASQAPQLLASGDVDYAYMFLSRWYNAAKVENKNFVPVLDGQAMSYVTWIIPKDAPNKDNAVKFLQYMMDPKRAAAFTNVLPYPPTRKSAVSLVDPAMMQNLTTTNDKNLVFLDMVWWADNGDEFLKRFEAWLQS